MKISVNIICYNYGNFLEEAVESVLRQNYQDFEILIIDPESSDNTPEVAQNQAALDRRIRYFRIPFCNISASRNFGIRNSQGEAIALLDADDTMSDIRLQKSAESLRHADMVYGNCINSGNGDELWEAPEGVDYQHLMTHNKSIPCCTVAFLKDIVDKIGYFDESLDYCEDYDYWIRAAKNGMKIVKINEILAHRRVHESNLWAVRTDDEKKKFYREIVRRKHAAV